MDSEVGGPTEDELDLLFLVRANGDLGLRLTERRERGLGVRLQARGLVTLCVPDVGDGDFARLTSKGAEELLGREGGVASASAPGALS